MKSNDLNKAGALVVFSGGQDSTTCLAWALDRYEQVETVGFDYGQVHSIEISVRHKIRDQMTALRPAWRAQLGPDHVHAAGVIGQIRQTRLTGSTATLPITEELHHPKTGKATRTKEV